MTNNEFSFMVRIIIEPNIINGKYGWEKEKIMKHNKKRESFSVIK